jgi:hypothetical protein
MAINHEATTDSAADQLPQLRAWAKVEAERGRAMSDVAAELSVRWGVGPIPVRKLLMEAFTVGLATANEVCGSIGSAPDGHPWSARANAQLSESWMRDMVFGHRQQTTTDVSSVRSPRTACLAKARGVLREPPVNYARLDLLRPGS